MAELPSDIIRLIIHTAVPVVDTPARLYIWRILRLVARDWAAAALMPPFYADGAETTPAHVLSQLQDDASPLPVRCGNLRVVLFMRGVRSAGGYDLVVQRETALTGGVNQLTIHLVPEDAVDIVRALFGSLVPPFYKKCYTSHSFNRIMVDVVHEWCANFVCDSINVEVSRDKIVLVAGETKYIIWKSIKRTKLPPVGELIILDFSTKLMWMRDDAGGAIAMAVWFAKKTGCNVFVHLGTALNG